MKLKIKEIKAVNFLAKLACVSFLLETASLLLPVVIYSSLFCFVMQCLS